MRNGCRRFNGRAVLITGGASGIGRAAASAFAAEGGRVALVDIRFDLARAVAAEISAGGGDAIALKADVTSTEEVRRVVSSAVESFGPLEVVVANAGWQRLKPFAETDEALWNQLIDLNLRGQMATIHAALPEMIRLRSGRIVTVASEAGRAGTKNGAAYSAAKGGVIAFTKAIARELAEYGITANSIAPGVIDTPLIRELHSGDPAQVEALLTRVPAGRIGRPDEVAAAILFLASDDASYITGQTLSVNGGMSMT